MSVADRRLTDMASLRIGAHVDRVDPIAAALERHSSHPIARAVLGETAARGIPLPRAQEVSEEPGVGMAGVVDGRRWRLAAGDPGVVELRDDQGVHSRIRLADVVRADAAATVRALRARGLRVALLTGDHPEVAQRIAQQAGIEEVVARIDPAAKAAWVRRERAAGAGTGQGEAQPSSAMSREEAYAILGLERGADAAAIRDGADAEDPRGAHARKTVEDVEAAADLLARIVRPGDVVLIKASRSAALDGVVPALERRLSMTAPTREQTS